MADNAEQLVTLIREIIKEEIKKQDTTVPCVVESINVDNTVNLYIMPDMQNVITNILNPNDIPCAAGDVVLLYKVKNQINNSFIIANYTKRN